MPTVADVLRQYGPEYLERFGATMPVEHKKVLNAIMACRTGELGMVFYECTSCGRTHAMGRSCGNRHCPSCQQDKTKAWLEAQTDRLLPCPYFLLTFTVPAALRGWIRGHQRIAYAALFEASSEAIKTLVADPKYVGAAEAASSESCTPGAAPWSITRTSTTSCRAGASAPTARDGCRHMPISWCPCMPCRSSFAPSSATLSTAPACWRRSIPPCGARTGWFTRKPSATAGRR